MKLLETKPLHRGKHVDFVAKTYRREDGSEVEREVVEHPGSVAVLAYDEEFAYLVGQPREAVEEDRLLEIPAGTLDHEGDFYTCTGMFTSAAEYPMSNPTSTAAALFATPSFFAQFLIATRIAASSRPVT